MRAALTASMHRAYIAFMSIKPKLSNGKLIAAALPAKRADRRARLRAAFEARAIICKGCGRSFVPGKGRPEEYCHVCLSPDPDAYLCAGCGALLSDDQVARGDVACAQCEAADTRFLPLDRAPASFLRFS